MKEKRVKNDKSENIKPYENNPRNNEEAVQYVANSIKEFGFKVPLVIDKDRVIVTGHTRYKAAKLLGMEELPCIMADDLTEEQIKAFRIADNKVSEVATWNEELLELELSEINIDMSSFGIEIESMEDIGELELDNEGYRGDERERTNKAYNLGLLDSDKITKDFWQMPVIKDDRVIPVDLIGFNYARTSKQKEDVGVHFYLDDYQFERVWKNPKRYIDILWEYDCILGPDFSLYMDMPMPMKIWNTYRNRFLGAFYQSKGIKVIPTVSWAEPETYEFCFNGIPEGSTVSISTVGVKRDNEALKVWKDGTTEMIRKIKPKKIILYGGEIDYDFGDIKIFPFENKVTENWT